MPNHFPFPPFSASCIPLCSKYMSLFKPEELNHKAIENEEELRNKSSLCGKSICEAVGSPENLNAFPSLPTPHSGTKSTAIACASLTRSKADVPSSSSKGK